MAAERLGVGWLAAGAAVAVLGLSYGGLTRGCSTDEAANLLVRGWAAIWADPETGVNPPLLRWTVMALAGPGEELFVGRCLSWLATGLAAGLAAALARRASGSAWLAIPAAALVVSHPQVTNSATELRSYGLFTLLAASHVAAWTWWAASPSARSRGVVALTALLLPWSHLLGFGVVAGCAVVSSPRWRAWLPALTFAALGTTPLVLRVMDSTSRRAAVDPDWTSGVARLISAGAASPPVAGGLGRPELVTAGAVLLAAAWAAWGVGRAAWTRGVGGGSGGEDAGGSGARGGSSGDGVPGGPGGAETGGSDARGGSSGEGVPGGEASAGSGARGGSSGDGVPGGPGGAETGGADARGGSSGDGVPGGEASAGSDARGGSSGDGVPGGPGGAETGGAGARGGSNGDLSGPRGEPRRGAARFVGGAAADDALGADGLRGAAAAASGHHRVDDPAARATTTALALGAWAGLVAVSAAAATVQNLRDPVHGVAVVLLAVWLAGAAGALPRVGRAAVVVGAAALFTGDLGARRAAVEVERDRSDRWQQAAADLRAWGPRVYLWPAWELDRVEYMAHGRISSRDDRPAACEGLQRCFVLDGVVVVGLPDARLATVSDGAVLTLAERRVPAAPPCPDEVTAEGLRVWRCAPP